MICHLDQLMELQLLNLEGPKSHPCQWLQFNKKNPVVIQNRNLVKQNYLTFSTYLLVLIIIFLVFQYISCFSKVRLQIDSRRQYTNSDVEPRELSFQI